MQNKYLNAHVARLLRSFRHWSGKDLLEANVSPEERGTQLFEAPFALLSHDASPDPILNYANRTALRLFGVGRDELVVMPSRLTAQALEQAERNRLLARVSAQGYIDDYRGVRITKDGRRFLIQRATVWNLLDETGDPYGQAATFNRVAFSGLKDDSARVCRWKRLSVSFPDPGSLLAAAIPDGVKII